MRSSGWIAQHRVLLEHAICTEESCGESRTQLLARPWAIREQGPGLPRGQTRSRRGENPCDTHKAGENLEG